MLGYLNLEFMGWLGFSTDFPNGTRTKSSAKNLVKIKDKHDVKRIGRLTTYFEKQKQFFLGHFNEKQQVFLTRLYKRTIVVFHSLVSIYKMFHKLQKSVKIQTLPTLDVRLLNTRIECTTLF